MKNWQDIIYRFEARQIHPPREMESEGGTLLILLSSLIVID